MGKRDKRVTSKREKVEDRRGEWRWGIQKRRERLKGDKEKR